MLSESCDLQARVMRLGRATIFQPKSGCPPAVAPRARWWLISRAS